MNIGLIAHDGRKQELLDWVEYNMTELRQHKLYATGTTGRLIRERFNMHDGSPCRCHDYDEKLFQQSLEEHYGEEVVCLKSGPLGGDQQMGAMIAEGKIDILIFFCDNLITQGHQQDVSALSRLASLYNIAFATNRTTADMILTSPLLKDPGYRRILPGAIERYRNRKLDGSE